ncbi:aldehyde dehydrogenase family protein [Paucihalobacter ruber]|uniref:Aldehyde dehydrogenase n=1 Tax=Paucihalobacter ruber TaxID=2567861 RepID=A0A506PQK5_9FLAO|nr:aldehyde dehydrogenase family protein [Paucihalobacter ruber]TPV35879.1 aldehyde dehydrogenase family protein [Paucihalobacter ruber]
MNIVENPYLTLFQKQQAYQFEVGNTTVKARLQKLNRLKAALEVTYRSQIHVALKKDLNKSITETDLTEIYPIISEIKHVKRHLWHWVKNQKVPTPLSLFGASSYIKYEPKGVCLIISPWNFPLNLTFGPLVSAIAAGNTVILKPSEMTPHTSALMKTMVQDLFDETEVALVEGEVETAQHLLNLPFNHIFFTGSPAVGKIVMKAAAAHLSSVTLELGGKSPAIIDQSANLKTTARRLIWGKLVNCGQTCIAPDYVLIDKTSQDVFIDHCIKSIEFYYSQLPETSNSYGRIVNQHHLNRLKSLIDDAVAKGATVAYGGNIIESENYIQPTIITNCNNEMRILQEEIFGPILPIVNFRNTEDILHHINANHKPLAVYIFSDKKSFIKTISNNTRAGTTVINNNLIQFNNHHLPFGGSNNSGIGKSHGYYGFKAFSNERAFMKQHFKGISEYVTPPYTSIKEKIAALTVRWF